MKLSSTTAPWWARGAAPLPQSARASSPPLARSSSRGSGGRRKAATCSRKLQKVCGVNSLCSWCESYPPPPPPFSLAISVAFSFHPNSSMLGFLSECYRPLWLSSCFQCTDNKPLTKYPVEEGSLSLHLLNSDFTEVPFPQKKITV